DQAGGRGDRARALHQLRDRQEAPGRALGGEPGRRRRALHPAPAHRAPGAMSDPATLLLVDDGPRVLDSLEALLGMEHPVLRADKPDHALAILATEPVALVISDQRMPGMLGTELLSRSREVAPDTVRVLLTAFTDLDALMDSINAAGIYQFVLKPWDPKELQH